MTLSEYIKNRRLLETNKDLLRGEKVTDVAFKYGYESIDGFTRAFKKWSGFLPSDVTKKGVSNSCPKLSFIISIKGGTAMDFRIEEKPAFYLAGAKENGYVIDINEKRHHHEICLSDPRKTDPSKLKTIIRHPVRKL